MEPDVLGWSLNRNGLFQRISAPSYCTSSPASFKSSLTLPEGIFQLWCLTQTEKKERNKACGKRPFSGWRVGARDESPSAWPRCRRSINHPERLQEQQHAIPERPFAAQMTAPCPFPSPVINDTVPRFPFSFSGGDKHGALYWHCGVLSSRQSVVGLVFFFFLQGCRAEMSQFSPPFLPLARQSVASAGGDAHVGGKWMIPLRL